jgi:hypothetical protein
LEFRHLDVHGPRCRRLQCRVKPDLTVIAE